MSEQPTALRLADALAGFKNQYTHKAAAELRRLHAEVEEQCRLNGMGSEREAKLMAEVKALKQDRRVLQATGDHPAPCARHCEANAFEIELRRLHAEVKALRADAERYRWLRDNSNNWSWNPSKYNDDVVSGFAANGTGYLGYSFAAAIDAYL